MTSPSFLTRLGRSLAPEWTARRLTARIRVDALAAEMAATDRRQKMRGLVEAVAGYDGAARGHRTAGRRIASTSADRESWTSLTRLRDVHRELVRNNAYAARAVQVITSNVVGTGITVSIADASKKVKSRLATLVTDHLETPAIDFDGRHNLYGLQALAMRTVVESGEALIVRYRRTSTAGLPLPFQVRVLEPDYLVPWIDGSRAIGKVGAGNFVSQGIEYDPEGRRVAYHLYKEHPGSLFAGFNQDWIRVPVDDVIHLYRVDRPGQSRGVPWGAPVIMTMWDLSDYEEAELMRQKIAACFAVFWIDSEGRTKLGSDPNAPPTDTGLPVDMLEPGLQQRLPPGVDVKFATPPVTQGFEAYTRANIRKLAIGYGVPYEALAGDLSQVNFSSGRMGWLEFQRGIGQWQWSMLIPHMCAGIGRWFLDAAEFRVPGATLARLKHTEPRREMIDPTKEIPAARDAIRSGLSSRSEELRRMGYDPEKVDAEIAEENARADGLKLLFDSDGRHPMGAPMTAVSKDTILPGDPKGNGNA
ncbi:phage portal protein [Siculibacillus lacustris]|uniref:Phage portal protein n=1 Tax=Siculibacillus lacustris TaxID=1549641 RepID=A0A4Q9VF91_9HYPH|nr:phage portal protein [Siculibacillus lacustris]TBW33363.1 phage portal protein [Siculibacillus lacustris]